LLLRLLTGLVISGTSCASAAAVSFLQEIAKNSQQPAIYSMPRYKKDNVIAEVLTSACRAIARPYKDKIKTGGKTAPVNKHTPIYYQNHPLTVCGKK
jgi:hypothetical protein